MLICSTERTYFRRIPCSLARKGVPKYVIPIISTVQIFRRKNHFFLHFIPKTLQNYNISGTNTIYQRFNTFINDFRLISDKAFVGFSDTCPSKRAQTTQICTLHGARHVRNFRTTQYLSKT